MAQAQSVDARNSSNLQNNKLVTAKRMKRMGYLSRTQMLTGSKCSSTLPAVRLGDVLTPGRQCPIRSPLDPCVQVLEAIHKVCRVALPGQPVHAGGRLSLEGEECVPQQFDIDMVVERGEPFLLPLPCGLSYAP